MLLVVPMSAPRNCTFAVTTPAALVVTTRNTGTGVGAAFETAGFKSRYQLFASSVPAPSSRTTTTGELRDTNVPSPRRPSMLPPHEYTVPSALSARPPLPPPEMDATPFNPGTSTG